MLTKRENLLIRPWQDRRYINHRNKVEHALPAIDVKPPPKRVHVMCKLKKLQKEAERCARIEQDNFTLLQHLRSIMHTSRIDNIWQEAPPNFLHRVGIYKTANGTTEKCSETEMHDPPTNRKERCLGCSPHRISKRDKIPEERIPWDPPRPRLSRRRSESLTAISCSQKEMLSSSSEKREINHDNNEKKSNKLRSKKKNSRNRVRTAAATITMSKLQLLPRTEKETINNKKLPEIETHSLVLSRGALKLSVNFPPHTTVILKDGADEKVIQSEFCQCSAIKPLKRESV